MFDNHVLEQHANKMFLMTVLTLERKICLDALKTCTLNAPYSYRIEIIRALLKYKKKIYKIIINMWYVFIISAECPCC